ncbi:MAG: hypothetical protein ABEJ03_03340 [Candidatus Nanohaloarchaea archaeon]
MKASRLALVLLAAVFLSETVSGASFGSFPREKVKQAGEGSSANFSIAVFNPGDEKVAVRIDAAESQEYSVSYPEGVTLSPGRVTESPSGSGWYHLGEGRFVSMRELEVRVEAENPGNSSVVVPLKLMAFSSGGEDSESASRAIYVEEYDLNLSGLKPDRTLSIEEEEDGNAVWEEVDGKDGRSVQKGAENSTEVRRNGSNHSSASEREEKQGDEGGSSLTYVLVFGIVASAIYLYSAL